MTCIVNERKLLLRLSKYDGFWRMDAENYSLFINYVSKYFQGCDCFLWSDKQDVIYAEIEEEELAKALPLFGAFSPDIESLILVMVFQGYLERPVLESSFTLRIWVKTKEGGVCIISSLFKIR